MNGTPDSEPNNLKEAMARSDWEHWKSAIESETTSLVSRGTWRNATPEETQLQPAIPSRWVFKYKDNSDGSISRYKARLVARGDRQNEGIDYAETFAPTARLESLRLILAYTAASHWIVEQIDVVTAFLNAKIDKSILMRLPDGQTVVLQNALYGLKQGGYLWNKDLHATLLDLGFDQSAYDSAIYTRDLQDADKAIIVATYVDDLVIASKQQHTVDAFKTALKSNYDITEAGSINYLLGIKVERNWGEGTMHLSQTSYIKNILALLRMDDATPLDSPIMHPKVAEDIRFENPELYRTAVGKLVWISRSSRPDICYYISILARTLVNPMRNDYDNLKRLMRYLKGTIDWGITIGGTINLTGFSDANFITLDDPESRSISGYVFLMGGPISWCCQRQSIVAQSTCESEYVALNAAGKEAVWLCELMRSIGINVDLDIATSEPMIVACDDQSAIRLVQNPAFHPRSKHIDVKYHWVRQAVKENKLNVKFVPTGEQLADIFTKVLPARLHLAMCNKLRIQQHRC